MITDFTRKTFAFILINIVFFACSNHKSSTMNRVQSDEIIKEIKAVSKKITRYSEEAKLDSFLSYYDSSPNFLHFSSDGKMSNYEEIKEACVAYYTSLRQQTISTVMEKINVLDTNLVIFGWTGNIVAQFKNGDIMKMNNYSITNVFKRIDGKWKIIHSHESALPPESIKTDK